MRQSIGGAWLFSISITLMMFIIAYVAITIDYSNAYQLKDDVTLYIEQYNGLNQYSAQLIVQRMKAKKFTTKINCNKEYDSTIYQEGGGHKYDGEALPHYYGLVNYNTNYSNAFKRDPGQKSYLCIYKYKVINESLGFGTAESKEKHFYAVSTAFGFIFPIIGDVFNYRVTGETGIISYSNDSGFNFN